MTVARIKCCSTLILKYKPKLNTDDLEITNERQDGTDSVYFAFTEKYAVYRFYTNFILLLAVCYVAFLLPYYILYFYFKMSKL